MAGPVGARDGATPATARVVDPIASERPGPEDQPDVLASKPAAPAPEPASDALDLVDPSSPTAAFFQREDDSVPPFIDGIGDPEERLEVVEQLSPATLARRARLRRIVAAVAGLAGVISVAVVVKAVFSTKPSSTWVAMPAPTPASVDAKLSAVQGSPLPAREQAPAQVQPAPTQAAPAPATTTAEAEKVAAEQAAAEAAAAERVAADAAAAEKAAAEAAAAEKAAAEAAAAEKAAAEAAAAENAAAEKAAAEAVEAPAINLEEARQLKKEALSLLNRGRFKDAIEVSRKAIAADPTDALPYLYLGSALQDLGKWKDGVAAYSECVRHATKGPVHECRALGGRK